jgi:23S rRNA (guanosine2251-2'-O)-methyltransferase
MKIEGRNAVSEAIKSGKTIDRLVVSKDVKDAGGNKIIAEAKSRNIKIMFYDKAVLDRESETKRHQGFIAEITDYKYSTVEEILAYANEKDEKPFVIIVDGVEDPHNL